MKSQNKVWRLKERGQSDNFAVGDLVLRCNIHQLALRPIVVILFMIMSTMQSNSLFRCYFALMACRWVF